MSFLSMIERGERVPHLETLQDLSAALSVSLSELFLDATVERSDGDLVRPLAEFVRSHQLSAHDIEKLLGVARAMFNSHIV